MNPETTIAVAIDAGELPMGGELLSLIRPALQLLEPGGVLAINSCCDRLQDDLSVWCRNVKIKPDLVGKDHRCRQNDSIKERQSEKPSQRRPVQYLQLHQTHDQRGDNTKSTKN